MSQTREATTAHERVAAYAGHGKPADFSNSDDPAVMLGYDDEEFWAERSVSGDWLVEFLTDAASNIHRRGVIIVGARITGGLDLEAAELTRRLALLHCQLGDQRINLSDARTRSIRLTGTQCGGLSADGAQISGELLLNDGFRATGTVSLSGASIGGRLECAGAEFTDPDGAALCADSAEIAGGVFLGPGFKATGEVGLREATIGVRLSCFGGEFISGHPERAALAANGAQIGGGVFLGGGFKATGEVGLRGATIGGHLSCLGAEFTNGGAQGRALAAERAQITGNVAFGGGFKASGEVGLRGATIGGQLSCWDAEFSGGSPRVPALSAEGAHIAGDVVFGSGFRATGTVSLLGATIGGQLDCRSGQITNPAPKASALSADGAQITGGVLLERGFKATGEVALRGARIGGQLSCAGGEFHNPHPDGRALSADNAQITGGVSLSAIKATGEVALQGATVGGDLVCFDGEFTSGRPEGRALSADNAEITGDVFLGGGFKATGEVGLRGARIGGQLSCGGGTFTSRHPERRALSADNAQITGGVSLSDGFKATGEVGLLDARIGGQLSCGGGTFTSGRPEGRALSADNAEITGDVFLGGGFKATGEVGLRGARIGGQLSCGGGTFTSRHSERRALSADNAQITGGVSLSAIKATGEVALQGATVGGHLVCFDGEFTSGRPEGRALSADNAQITGGVSLSAIKATGEVALQGATVGGHLVCFDGEFTSGRPEGRALSADNARITGGVSFSDGFKATGEVGLLDARIGGVLGCAGGTFTSRHPEGRALSADRAQVTGGVFLRDGFKATGAVSLSSVSAGAFSDDKASWPDQIDLDGFRYNKLYSPHQTWRQRAQWLRRQPRPSPAAYLQLAAVYRAGGDDRAARKILIERHNTLLHPPPHWKADDAQGAGALGGAQRFRGPLRQARHRGKGAVSWLWRMTLRYTIGHGYAPWRVLFVAVPLVIAMSLWYADAKHQDLLVAPGKEKPQPVSSRCTKDYPCVQPVVYALDNLVPIVNFGQRDRWAPDQSHHDSTPYRDGRWLAAATWIVSALGWALATLVAASFTHVIRRD